MNVVYKSEMSLVKFYQWLIKNGLATEGINTKKLVTKYYKELKQKKEKQLKKCEILGISIIKIFDKETGKEIGWRKK